MFRDNSASLKIWLSNRDFEIIDKSTVDDVVLLALQPIEEGQEYLVLRFLDG
jgi:hypothetical protein